VPVQPASNFYPTTKHANQSIHAKGKPMAAAPIPVTSAKEMVFVALVQMASNLKRMAKLARNFIHAISSTADVNTSVNGKELRKPYANARKATNSMPIPRHVRRFTLVTRKIMQAVLTNV
jgi:hypothetical protein